jgi:cyclophilin family peptidyl-prolyl cis-trans isomerase
VLSTQAKITIFSTYLNSGDDQKTYAALLSIANSADTSWIPEIISLDFNIYGSAVSFILGKLGTSANSSEFLIDKLGSETDTLVSSHLIANIGKTGSLSDLDLINSKFSQISGYPISVFNFYSRNITNVQSINILTELLDTIKIDSKTQFETLFSLYRMGPDKSGLMKYVKFSESKNVDNKLFALGCLRKLEAFPDDMKLMKSILQHDDWRVRTEGVKSSCYKRFNSVEEIKYFTSLLYDISPNVSRTAAASIKDIRIPAALKIEVQDLLRNLLDTRGFNSNTLGELFVSYCSLYPEDIQDKIETYEDRIEPQFIHRVLSDNTDDPEWNFDYLVDQFKDADEKFLMSLVPPMLSLQSKLIEDDKYADLILSLYSGGYPAPIALLSYGLDTIFVKQSSEMFQQLIVDQTFKFLNNPQYAESLQSFPVLAGKVSESFKQTILNTLLSSKITSVANYAGSELNEDYKPIKKETGIFEKIWNDSFKYSEAVVTTGKGSFTIKFFPEYAPVSVGNFCLLAENNFFDNVIFHRVVPNFVIQTGDPSSTGWGGPGYEIISEFSWLNYEEAAVGMASAGKDTEGSQWFVMHSYHPHLNGNYSLFGKVTDGMEIVSRIDQDEKILDVTLVK